MNIYQKLIEVRKSVPYLQKGADGPQFKYVSSSQVLASLKNAMDELGLLLIPSVVEHKVTEQVVEYLDKDRYGNEKPKKTSTYFTELDLIYTWINAEKPEEKVTCAWYGQGVDIAGEKGVGKALTYAEKYFMLKFFNIPTDKDDPDSFQEKYNEEPKIDKIKVDTILSMVEKTNTNLKEFLKYYKLKKVEDMTVTDFMAAMQMLEIKERKQGNG